MKKIIFSILAIFFLTSPAFAISPSPTVVTPTKSLTQSLKDQLITNIASRVAQLKLVEKRGFIGKVTNVTNTQITVTDFGGNTRFVDVDELTKFSNPDVKGSYGISDIKKNTDLGILGLYNKESRRTLARFVNAVNFPDVTVGVVTSLDRSNFSLDILTEDNKRTTFDVETFTKTFSYTPTAGVIKSGFSQIKENYNIVVIGSNDAKRIVFFPR